MSCKKKYCTEIMTFESCRMRMENKIGILSQCVFVDEDVLVAIEQGLLLGSKRRGRVGHIHDCVKGRRVVAQILFVLSGVVKLFGPNQRQLDSLPTAFLDAEEDEDDADRDEEKDGQDDGNTDDCRYKRM